MNNLLKHNYSQTTQYTTIGVLQMNTVGVLQQLLNFRRNIFVY